MEITNQPVRPPVKNTGIIFALLIYIFEFGILIKHFSYYLKNLDKIKDYLYGPKTIFITFILLLVTLLNIALTFFAISIRNQKIKKVMIIISIISIFIVPIITISFSLFIGCAIGGGC